MRVELLFLFLEERLMEKEMERSRKMIKYCLMLSIINQYVINNHNSYNLFIQIMENSKEQTPIAKENQPNQDQEELITDFSQMFKGKAPLKRPSKRETRQIQQTPNWLLEIPARLEITKEEICERKVLNQTRWKSIVRCSDGKDRIIASVVSAWNYLFSAKGIGNQQFLSLKEAVKIFQQLGINYRCENQSQRAEVVLDSFQKLCNYFNCSSKGSIIIKSSRQAEAEFVQGNINSFLGGLAEEKTFYVFITYNNIFCPLGFDKTPLVPLDAFKKLSEIKPENIQLWIISGSTLRFEPSFVSKRWSDINQSLTTHWPYYFNLQQHKKGAQVDESANEQNKNEIRQNNYCILQFRRE